MPTFPQKLWRLILTVATRMNSVATSHVLDIGKNHRSSLMTQKLKLKNHFRVERLEPERVVLLSERGNHVLKGRTYYLLAPLLDGSHTISDIAEQLRGEAPFLEIHYALMRLQEKGYVVTVKDELPSEIEALCHSFDIDMETAGCRLAETKIFVTSIGSLPVDSFVRSLRNAHVQVSVEKADAALCVVLTTDYLQAALKIFNQDFLASKQPWMLVKPTGTILWLGPIFEAGKTGCWFCLAQRLKLHRRLETFLQSEKGVLEPFAPPLSFSLTTETALNLAAIEIVKWILQGENRTLTGNVLTIDIHSLEVEKHILIKRPQCPCCGDPNWVTNRMQQPIVLKNRRTFFFPDGGYRTLSPAETVAQYEHHVSKITGVVEKLQPGPSNGSHVINTYASGLNINYEARSYDGLRNLLQNGDLGKGATALQAKASALCEAIERYSGSFQGDEYRIKACYAELGEAAIHPNACLNFSEKQYQQAAEWNNQPQRIAFHLVPPRFDETREIEWTPVWSITGQRFKYLPASYCYYGYPGEEPSATPTCSNGCAAGNTLEEAIFHGFMELIERDSVSLWWYNHIRRPGVDLSSFSHPYLTELQAYYRSINRDLWVLDITSDLNIPTFAAISRKQNSNREDIILGFGAHFDPQLGILKAVTELNQVLSLFLVLKNGELPQGNGEATEWWQTATMENQPYLTPMKSVSYKQYLSYTCLWSDNIKDDVLSCVAIAEQHSMETLVLDQTQPDVGLNVVKVFVPGLRHFWRRLAPGRLYDAPVKLGRLDKPLQEDELNPFSIFI